MEPGAGQFTRPFATKFSERRDRNPSISVLAERIEAEEDMVYGLFVNLFETFCAADGVKSVLEIVSTDKLEIRAAALGMSGYRLPLEMVAAMLAPFRTVRAIAKDDICKTLVAAGMPAFAQRVSTLEVKDIKDMNKDAISTSLVLMKGFLRLAYSEEEAAKITQTHEMTLSLKFIQSGSLERRLNGLADIRRLIERVDYGPRFLGQTTLHRDSWLTSEYLTRWIVDNKILEMILNENAHPELVRRTLYILAYLARKKALTVGMLELLWKCQQDKHEDIIRVVYDTIKDLLDNLSNDVLPRFRTLPIGHQIHVREAEDNPAGDLRREADHVHERLHAQSLHSPREERPFRPHARYRGRT